jgi:hypothetical protein
MLLCSSRTGIRSAADQADVVAVGIGEHGDTADGRVGQGKDAGGSELLGAGERGIDVMDREVGDEPGIRTVLASLADPARRPAVPAADERMARVEDVDRPLESSR